MLIANDEPTTQFFNDKESVTANPVKAGTAYAVWDRLELPNGNPYANLHTKAFRGPTLFSKTTDGGKTWSTPKVIVNVPSRQQTIGNQIVIDPRSGTLYDFFDLIQPPFSKAAGKVAFIKSTDDGATHETAGDRRPADGRRHGSGHRRTGAHRRHHSGTRDRSRVGAAVRRGRTAASTAARTTRLRYRRRRTAARPSAPQQLNTPTGRPAFNPSVRVDNTGAVMVTYYDFRDPQAGNTTTLPTGFWRKISHDGGTTFTDERRVGGPFDMKLAPNAEGFFIGDYQGLTCSVVVVPSVLRPDQRGQPDEPHRRAFFAP